MDELIQLRSRDSEVLARCNKIVEEFISMRGLVVYGGSAIDFFLRGESEKMTGRPVGIYDDVMLPFTDYDVYTPNLAEDVIGIMQMLSDSFGNRNISAINAVHMRSMRVSYMGHFILDLNYVPAVIFEGLPRATYKTINGTEVDYVQPVVQVIDMHASLSEPFMNPPREVYNHRLEKDIKRFNLLRPFLSEPIMPQKASSPTVSSHVITGDAAAYLLCGPAAAIMLIGLAIEMGWKAPDNLPKVTVDGAKITLTCDSAWVLGEPRVSFLTKAKIEPTNRRLLDVFPTSQVVGSAILYRADDSLYGAWRSPLMPQVAIASVQLVLKQLLAATVFRADGGVRTIPPLYWCLLGALEWFKGVPPAAFMLGSEIWPGPDARNESMTAIYGRLRTAVNASGSEEKIRQVIGMRPPNLYMSSGNFETRKKDFLAWDVNSGFFHVDGSLIQAAK